MFDENPIQTQLRNERRMQRLGENAACAMCGFSKPEALTTAKTSLLEKHHIFLEANDPKTTVALCLNCHRTVTEGGLRAGAMRPASSCLERFELMLRSLGSFLIVLGEKLLEWAEEIAGLLFDLKTKSNEPGSEAK
jgi:hypothetical protein